MPIISIHNVGAIGFVPDVPPHELPPEAWSAVQNVRFANNEMYKFLGHEQQYGTLSGAPYWMLTFFQGSQLYWLYASLADVFVTDGVTHKTISKVGGYSATEDLGWSGGVLGGIPVLNNGVDVPQMWKPVDFGTPQLLQDLTGWQSGVRVRVLRPFLNYLVGVSVTKSGVSYPHLVKWSHPADSGGVPSSWDETDPTKDAGENTLSETSGHLVDCMALRDVNIVYKEDAIYSMQYIGGLFVFRFFALTTASGAISRRCMQSFRGRHVAFGYEDVITHDGQNIESIVNRRIKRWLYANLDGDKAKLSFVAPHLRQNELWFCFPETGASRPTLAAVWNFDENTWGVRELPESYSHIAPGILDTGAGSVWDAANVVWDNYPGVWSERAFDAATKGLLAADPTNSKFYKLDSTNQFNGTNMTVVLERTGLAMVGQDRTGQPKLDFDSVKFIKAIRPKIRSTGPVDIYVGAQMHKHDSVRWQGPVSFNPATDLEAFFNLPGRLMAVKFVSTGNLSWQLDSYDIEFELVSRY